MSRVPPAEAERGTRLKVDDFLDSEGRIVLREGVNLVSLLDRNVANFGDVTAYRYLDYTHQVDGKSIDLTWARLGVRLRAIAARVQQVTSRGERVAILAPQGLDYVAGFFAAIKAGNIAVPLFAPELPGHAERLDAVLADAQPAVVLTTAAAGEAVATFVRTLPRNCRPRIIAVDQLPDSVGATFVAVQPEPDDIAYLQYTSGSTRTPTGVEISHRAAGTNLLQMIMAIGLERQDIHGVSWLPLYHDMGLLMIGFPAAYGGHVTLMSPTAFVRSPRRWIQALAAESRYGCVVTAAPNFAFELVTQRGVPAEGDDVDLSNVILINGSEPVRIDSIAKFNEAFARYGLSTTAVKPSYGMAEATLFVSTTDLDAEAKAVFLDREQLGNGHAVPVAANTPNSIAYVSCGRIAPCQWGVIVDPEVSAELPDGTVGEIWLHGDNIGSGYWARKEETDLVFDNKLQSRLPVGSHADGAAIGARWLRTGDLGVYIDGELYITGRIKDLIIWDGRNHYPQDIEATVVEASSAVRHGYVAAFSVPANEMPGATTHAVGECLIIVAERAPGAGRVDPQSVVDAIRAAVSRRHGLPVSDVRLVTAGAIPRTTSGKLARRACRAQYLSGGLHMRQSS